MSRRSVLQKITKILNKIVWISAGIIALTALSSLFLPPEIIETLKPYRITLYTLPGVLSTIRWIIVKRIKWKERKRKRDTLPQN